VKGLLQMQGSGLQLLSLLSNLESDFVSSGMNISLCPSSRNYFCLVGFAACGLFDWFDFLMTIDPASVTIK